MNKLVNKEALLSVFVSSSLGDVNSSRGRKKVRVMMGKAGDGCWRQGVVGRGHGGGKERKMNNPGWVDEVMVGKERSVEEGHGFERKEEKRAG
ncbi:hypothetical protein L6452_10423 [Arctium lappa]|uniref:Uncharacterized protein n=1 Tax=Arctium lappa TaxID=4217 RepID=A0ACB9DNI5_ARCLA|nr:hypothetical protein L6452_10423 [Arctium lappa]